MLVTMMDDLKRDINSIEEKIKSDINKKGKLSMTAVVEIKKDIREMIQFHGDIKQLNKTKKINILCANGSNNINFIYCSACLFFRKD